MIVGVTCNLESLKNKLLNHKLENVDKENKPRRRKNKKAMSFHLN